MTKKDGKPCNKCGTSEWDKRGNCKRCAVIRACNWQRQNKERKKEISRKYDAKNKQKKAAYTKRYRAENRDRRTEYNRKWFASNPGKSTEYFNVRRTRRTKAGGSFTAQEWKALCKQYNNHCCYPGCERTDLQADHVIPVSRGGTSDISNIQPLCKHHNFSKSDKAIDYRTKPGVKRWIQKKLFG